MNDITLPSDNPLRFRKNLNVGEMIVCEKVKSIDNKMEQNKAQYDLDRQKLRFQFIIKEF